jgi:hypothetical protein
MHSAGAAGVPPIPKQSERPRWNDWTTRRLVQFDYEDEAVSRVVRLTNRGTRVGEAIRVGISGVEVEGRLTAIDGTTLRVVLSARAAKKKMAKAAPQSSSARSRGKAG